MHTQLVPIADYARSSGVSEAALRQHIKAERIRGIRLGRSWYVLMDKKSEQQRQAQVLTFFTHAGGTGKTSLVRDLGFDLSVLGYRVLLVDADPQANLTAWLGIQQEEVRTENTLLQAVEHGVMPQPLTGVLGGVALDLIPASMNLAMAEMLLPGTGLLVWRNGLKPWRSQYDFILVDSPPSLGPIAATAAMAGDGLVVPVETSAKGMQALWAVMEVSHDYQRSLLAQGEPLPGGSFVRLLVPTQYDPRTAQDRKVRSLLETSGVGPLAPYISYRPGPYKEAIDRGVPVQAVGVRGIFEEIRCVTNVLLNILGVKEVGQ